MSKKLKVLYLCTGNSCRSQMAEGWGKALGAEVMEVRSAGIEAHGKNPRAIQVMHEAGVDISNQESTKLTDDMLSWADLVISVCGHADEHCPVLPPHVKKRHVPFDDPARARGTEEQIMEQFRKVRDEIRAHVETLVQEIKS